MNIKDIERLIKLVNENNIDEIEITEWGHTVRIIKNSFNMSEMPHQVIMAPTAQLPMMPQGTTTNEIQQPTNTPQVESKEKDDELKANWLVVKSPMVATFYSASSPTAKPFIEVGDTIRPGQVLCILEAMKLMNELEAEISGRIVKILIEKSQPVEYGQELFYVYPNK